MLLSKPSMENIDNSFIDMRTNNGMVIQYIKNSLEKELGLSAKEKIKKCVEKIVGDWDLILDNARVLLDFLCQNEYKYEYFFDRVINTLADLKYPDIQNIPRYTLSPIETLYMKVVQHEYLGNIVDIVRINDIPQGYDYTISPEYIEEMKKFHFSSVDIKEVEQYIVTNAKRISKYVYLKEKVSGDEIKKIRNAKRKVTKLIEFFKHARTGLDMRSISNELLIISCLQAIILGDSNEDFDYKFFGYQKDSKHMKRVQAALKNDEYVPQALQMYWVRKVTDCWYANIGRYEGRIKLRQLEQVCNNILIEILSKPDLNDMLQAHQYYYEKVEDDLITTKEQIQAICCFMKYLRGKGFEYVDDYFDIHYVFLYPPEIKNTYSALIGLIDKLIGNHDNCIQINMDDFSSAKGERKWKIGFNLVFDYEKKECIMSGFNKTVFE